MNSVIKNIVIKKSIAIMVLLGFFGGCVGVDPQGRGYSMAIPMSMINSALADNFPVSQKVSYGMVSGLVNIEDPTILGKSGSDKLGVGTAFKFTNMFIPNGIVGKINLASGVRYDAKSKNLFLANPMVNELKFQNFSMAKYLTAEMRNAIGLVIANAVAKKPIYNINKSSTLSSMGSGLVKGIDVRNGQVFVTFGF
jgi:hypothetical protein